MNEKSTKKQNPLFMILTALLALTSLILAGALMMTKGQVEEAQQNISSLEATVSQQKDALSAYESEHWSAEEQKTVIALASSVLTEYYDSSREDHSTWAWEMAFMGTEKFKTWATELKGFKYNGYIARVEGTDFSQADKAVVTLTAVPSYGQTTSERHSEVTVVRDGNTFRIDEIKNKGVKGVEF